MNADTPCPPCGDHVPGCSCNDNTTVSQEQNLSPKFSIKSLTRFSLLAFSMLAIYLASSAEVLAQQLQSCENPPHRPQVCVGFVPNQGWSGYFQQCPAGYAFYGVNDPAGTHGPGSKIQVTGPCCPLPASDILTDQHVMADTVCPDGHVATGADNSGATKLMRCTKVNLTRYGLTGEALWGEGRYWYWSDNGRIKGSGWKANPAHEWLAWAEIPVGIRYAHGRVNQTTVPNADGCVARIRGANIVQNWAGLMVRKDSKQCGNMYFRRLFYKGVNGDPAPGTIVPLFPNCTSDISDLTDPNATCTGEAPPFQCSDGDDNDGDGAIDDADLGCECLEDDDEAGGEACDDGIDNDGDGRIDAGNGPNNDPGCSDVFDDDEQDPNLPCDDGEDNDGDGKIDTEDPGCDNNPAGPSENDTDVECNDGIDNDGDGFTDFNLDALWSDPGCTGFDDTSETDPNLICDDGVDNDKDGDTDFGPAGTPGKDPGCSSPKDNTETDIDGPACDDGLDNDLDQGIDVQGDLGCADNTDDDEHGDDICDNGIDDDKDGVIDYAIDPQTGQVIGDPGCTAAIDDSERDPNGDVCDNGIDEDGDGKKDYATDGSGDPGCTSRDDGTEENCIPKDDIEMQDCQTNQPGICKDGEQFRVCGDDYQYPPEWGECISKENPKPEVCDNQADDDCDGWQDYEDTDDCQCRPGVTPDEKQNCDVPNTFGRCLSGWQARSCGNDSKWGEFGECISEKEAIAEICGNGIDDDCDGKTDFDDTADCVCEPGVTPDEKQNCNVPNTFGRCLPGWQARSCAQGGQWGDWGECLSEKEAIAEVCGNNQDDDCDGQTDFDDTNDCQCEPGVTPDDKQNCSVPGTFGICVPGWQARQCQNDGSWGAFGACESEKAPIAEICDNNQDDDCDGKIDGDDTEDCECIPGVTEPEKQDCDTGNPGICGPGWQQRECQANGKFGEWGECLQEKAPKDETPEANTCDNNEDDDCDGDMDGNDDDCNVCPPNGTTDHVFIWDNPGCNHNAGKVMQVDVSFNPDTQMLRWVATFAKWAGRIPSGFEFAVNGTGQNPKGHDGELAFFFYDANNFADPKLTVYGFNSLPVTGDTQTSWRDGSKAPGNQPPDKILSSVSDNSFVKEFIAQDNPDGTRTLGFVIDATKINKHVPLYPDAGGQPWQGAQWGEKLGMWFHPTTNLQATYGADGFLTKWWWGILGWCDTANQITTPVPGCGDLCPEDPNKVVPGECGCGLPDEDSDNDGVFDCNEVCFDDPDKTEPGVCGCGVPDDDSDGDGGGELRLTGRVAAPLKDIRLADKGEFILDFDAPETDVDFTVDQNTQEVTIQGKVSGCIYDCRETPQLLPGLSWGVKAGKGVFDIDLKFSESVLSFTGDLKEPGVRFDEHASNGGTIILPENMVHSLWNTGQWTAENLRRLDVMVKRSNDFGYAWGFWKKNDGTFDGAGWLSVTHILLPQTRIEHGGANTEANWDFGVVSDGVPDCLDGCPDDPNKEDPGVCGCGVPDVDTDGDTKLDCEENCPNDPDKIEPGQCQCGTPDTDTDGDGTADCNDQCPNNKDKIEPGQCGCDAADGDRDNDGTPDCEDQCPDDAGKVEPGQCGCGTADTDTDGDGTADCNDQCIDDPAKTAVGECGCGVPDVDTDGDGALNCKEECPADPDKQWPGACGCGTADTDTDGDGTPDCKDECDDDPNKQWPGECGCGTADDDTDGDGALDCKEECPADPDKQWPGACGCGTADTDTDGDGTPDCTDECIDDANKTEAGECGCGIPDEDTDGDGVLDCNENCPEDPDKFEEGMCGCGIPETNSDNDDIGEPIYALLGKVEAPLEGIGGVANPKLTLDFNDPESDTVLEIDEATQQVTISGKVAGCIVDCEEPRLLGWTWGVKAGRGLFDINITLSENVLSFVGDLSGEGISFDAHASNGGTIILPDEMIVPLPGNPTWTPEELKRIDVMAKRSDAFGFAWSLKKENGAYDGTGWLGINHVLLGGSRIEFGGANGEANWPFDLLGSGGNGMPDCIDECDFDPNKTEPGVCGCGVPDVDTDGDGTLDCEDECSDDPGKTDAGVCGCGTPDTDSDGDGVADCNDQCQDDPDKTEPGACGCGVLDTDTDGDGAPDCKDECDDDPNKQWPGECGCGTADDDTDGDGALDCKEECPEDANKQWPGECGCGVADDDTDGDGTFDCFDECIEDADKTEPGACGCGVPDDDSDGDGTLDCQEVCDFDPNKTDPGECDCGTPDTDADGDGTFDCFDECIDDANKTEPGECGCGIPDEDNDGDGVLDCNENCPEDPDKFEEGMCGCGIPETNSDNDDIGEPIYALLGKVEAPLEGIGGVANPKLTLDFNDPESDTVLEIDEATQQVTISGKVAGCIVDCEEPRLLGWTWGVKAGRGLFDINITLSENVLSFVGDLSGEGISFDAHASNGGTIILPDEMIVPLPGNPTWTPEELKRIDVMAKRSDAFGFAWSLKKENGAYDGTGWLGINHVLLGGSRIEFGGANGEANWPFDLLGSGGNGMPDCIDECDFDPNKTEPGVCGCGVPDVDTDGDGTLDCEDECSDDPGKTDAGVCGCGTPDTDSDGDGTPDCNDGCTDDQDKTEPGACGCGVPDTDTDGDGTPDCTDECDDDPNKQWPGQCGCDVADDDTDGDGALDCKEECPADPDKQWPGACGCGTADTDTDGDGTPDCTDECDDDPNKQWPGECGCGTADDDTDGDGTLDCKEECPEDANKQTPGECGCGVVDDDTDGDGTFDCFDECTEDADKTEPGACGCGVPDDDSDGDGTLDCQEVCDFDPNKTDPGECDCGTPDTDADGDGTFDCFDECIDDANKTEPGECGCGIPDEDADGDGVLDCNENCPEDPDKFEEGMCGCGIADTNSDNDEFGEPIYAVLGRVEAPLEGIRGVEDPKLILDFDDPDSDTVLEVDEATQQVTISGKVAGCIVDCEEPRLINGLTWGVKAGRGIFDFNVTLSENILSFIGDLSGEGIVFDAHASNGGTIILPDEMVVALPGNPTWTSEVLRRIDVMAKRSDNFGFAWSLKSENGTFDGTSWLGINHVLLGGTRIETGGANAEANWPFDLLQEGGNGMPDCMDECDLDPNKTEPGECGCGVPDIDSDGDGTLDCNEECPEDAHKTEAGECGCGTPDTDSDGDGVADCNDQCQDDPDKTEPGACGCGSPDTDADGDGTPVCEEECDEDPAKLWPGTCGCGVADDDTDGDGVVDCEDGCVDDTHKTEPGECGCGTADTDTDGDGAADCNDQCAEDADKTAPGECGCGVADVDTDGDGVLDCNEVCMADPDKNEPGECGCGTPDTDSDGDGTMDCEDECPNDKHKTGPGSCGCGNPDTDGDGDGTPVCEEECDNDPNKLQPGACGCGVADDDTDGDGVVDCEDGCVDDKHKTEPGECGCGTADTDIDGDGAADCNDQCAEDADKTAPGECGCGVADVDTDGDGVLDCNEVCMADPDKNEPGDCGCGTADTDGDGDGAMDCADECPDDKHKTAPGECGCGTPDTDSDGDGVADCNDQCPNDGDKIEAGACGCGTADTDADGDGTPVCEEECDEDPDKLWPGTCGCGTPDDDSDGDGVIDCEDQCPHNKHKTEPGECGCDVADDDVDGDGMADCLDECPDDGDKQAPGICGCGEPDSDHDDDGDMDCPECEEGDTDILECQTDLPGVCAIGTKELTCDQHGQWTEPESCEPTIVPDQEEELCDDGLDNNCNGEVDENCTVIDEVPPGDCTAGEVEQESCEMNHEVGQCAVGTRSRECQADETWGDYGECSPLLQPSAEICDDLIDNDCDGSIDGRDADCLNCKVTDTLPMSRQIDGGMNNQKKIIVRLARRIGRVIGGSKGKRAAKKFRQEGSELALKGWAAGWSFPEEVRECPETDQCVQIDLAPVFADIESAAGGLVELADEMIGYIGKRNGKSKYERTLMKRMKKRASRNMEVASHFPLSATVCDG